MTLATNGRLSYPSSGPMLRRLVISVVALLALFGVCMRAPSLELVRRAAGSLEAVAAHAHERPSSLEKAGEQARIRATRTSRAGDPQRDPSLAAPAVVPAVTLIACSTGVAAREPLAASWAPLAPSHADLMVFLN